MSDEFSFEDNDDIFSNIQFPGDQSAETLQEVTNILPQNDNFIPTRPTKETIQTPSSEPTSSPLAKVTQTSTKRNISPEDPNCGPNQSKKDKKSGLFLVKRLFPGPAGIFLEEGSLNEQNESLVCTQATLSVFQDGFWLQMTKDFSLGPNTSLPDRFNIEWIKTQASQNLFFNYKAPFLAGVIQSLDVVGAQNNVNVTLRDMTGSIEGMIEHNLYTTHIENLTIGSILVVVNFTILSCNCNKCDNFHLTITKNNLCAIYNKKKVEIQKVDAQRTFTEYYKKLNDHKNTLEKLKTKNKTKEVNSNTNKYHSAGWKNMSKSLDTTSCSFKEHKFNKCFTSFNSKNENPSFNTNVLNNSMKAMQNSNNCKNNKKFTFKACNSVKASLENTLIENKDVNKVTKSNAEKINNIKIIEETEINSKSQDTVLKISNSQISVTVNKVDEKEIWEKTLEGIDMESFFEDF